MKRTLTLLTIAIVALCSCNRSLEVATSSQGTMFKVSAAPFYGESDASATKSAYFNESDSHKITDFNVWVYDFSTGELVNGGGQYKTYFTDPREVNGYYLFPDFSKKYEIYMLANLGKQDAPLNRADAEAYRYKFSDYDTFKTKGFPMAAHYCFVPSDPSTSHDLQLMRLVSRFNIQFKFGEDNNYDFVLKGAVVRNSAKVVSPFAKESKVDNASNVFRYADALSVSELSANGGVVYMIENIQGDNVFKDPVKRTADNMTRDILRDCTTYLEFSGELNRKDGTGYRKVRCLYYFGEGTFAGVRRNYNTPIVLTMTNTFTNNDNWTVEPMDPYSNAIMKFNDIGPYTSIAGPNFENTSITRNGEVTTMYGRAFIGNAFADDVNYKYVFDEQALNNAGVTAKISYPNDGGQKAVGQFGKGPSEVEFTAGNISKANADIEFKAVDKYGVVLGKYSVRIYVIPDIDLYRVGFDLSGGTQDGGRLIYNYELYVTSGGIPLDPTIQGEADYSIEIIDWGYHYKNGVRIPFDFDENRSGYNYECTYQKDLTKIDIHFDYDYGNYQDFDNTDLLLLNVILKDGRRYQVESKINTPNPNPNPNPNPKKSGLYYSRDSYSYKPIEQCGTYSSGLGINTSSYDGECYYYSSYISTEYTVNGAEYPVFNGGKEAKFKYYENDVEKNIKVSVSSPNLIWKDTRFRNRTNSQYPYQDGRYLVGSHKSYVIITITFPDNHDKRYWGYITEHDDFGGLFQYYR